MSGTAMKEKIMQEDSNANGIHKQQQQEQNHLGFSKETKRKWIK